MITKFLGALLLIAVVAPVAEGVEVTASRANGILTVSLTQPPEGSFYTHVIISLGDYVYEPNKEGQHSWEINTQTHAGTITAILCDDNSCLPINLYFSDGKEYEEWQKLSDSINDLLLCVVLVIVLGSAITLLIFFTIFWVWGRIRG